MNGSPCGCRPFAPCALHARSERESLSQWLAHRLRNAMTPVTIRAEVVEAAAAAALPSTPGEIHRLIEAVAHANEVIEEVIAEVRCGLR